MSHHHHISTKPHTVFEILESLTTNPSLSQTTVIVCSTKHTLLTQLQHDLSTYHTQANQPRTEIPASQEDEEIDPDPSPQHPPPKHSFLTPTLHLLSTTREINLIFCPTVNALRAFISSHTTVLSTHEQKQKLLILDLLALHQDTSEFTLQGLSRTFAAIASLRHRDGLELRMVECSDGREAEEPEVKMWDREVPLLSGSVRLGGGNVAGWAGRRVSVRQVAERWFYFDPDE